MAYTKDFLPKFVEYWAQPENKEQLHRWAYNSATGDLLVSCLYEQSVEQAIVDFREYFTDCGWDDEQDFWCHHSHMIPNNEEMKKLMTAIS
jgi:hypothetical protein